MKKFIGTALALCCLALPLAGCEDAISTVTSTTMSELEDIPNQILATPESAEMKPEYNYIHFRYDNIWTVSALLTPPTIEIVGFPGGGGKAYHHAAYKAASYTVSHHPLRV